MLSALHRRLHDDRDEGFTLIELMVVILIIAILLAIAIPTFLGARSRAQDRAAQSSLRNALTSADVAYANTNDYSQAIPATLTSLEPALSFPAVGTGSSGPNVISTATAQAGGSSSSVTQEWFGAALSKSNTCFFVTVVKVSGNGSPNTGTWYSQMPSASTSTCVASSTLPSGASAWAASWT
ncbi:MAG TPA: prepilin-type N-terminal cleavage/methylation domain-containing protein [Acidimicrobiales bacterium]|nr:prepilin-type N-terminal cleavage/methylation domain-containing protein [Acidimicrobiales bacterium]